MRFISENNLAALLGTSNHTVQTWGKNGLYQQHKQNGISGFYMEELRGIPDIDSMLESKWKEESVVSPLRQYNSIELFCRRWRVGSWYVFGGFPESIALNKLYYFMPYIKGKGVRDLFFIKVARLGYRKEGTSEENPNDLRLVFEVEFVKQLFPDYKPMELKIWRTFTDITMGKLIAPHKLYVE